MELVLEDASAFRKSIDAIAVLVDEAEFLINDKGFFLKATDPSQISMIDFSLQKKDFKEFKVKGETKIALDLDYLAQVMGRAKARDNLAIALDKDNSRLQLVFSGTSTRKFSIPLIDVSSREVPSPRIEFDAELKLKAEILQDGLKDASLLATHISLGVDKEKFFMKANSSKGTLNNETSKKEKSMLEFKVKQECSAMFPLDYLQGMLKAAGNDSEVNLFLKANAPIKINYLIGKAEITYFLAPRVDTS